jgi:hypothetical protein
MEHFADDDDNDNDSDDVEDVFVYECRCLMIVGLSGARFHPAAKAQPQRKIAAPGFQLKSRKQNAWRRAISHSARR